MNTALPTQMKATQFEETGAPGVLISHEVARPEIKADELLIETTAVGVNFIETYQRGGVYPVELPFTPGTEAAGVVVAVGSDVRGFEEGDRVATASARGTYAEYCTAPAELIVKIPDEIPDNQAAALPLQGMTAHYLINSTFDVQPGQTVLFHAGAGGVGGLAIQLLKAKGATVITTVSSDEKETIAKTHGADHVLRYEDFGNKVREIIPNGVDVVYDSIGKTTFDESLGCLKKRGMLVLFGGASGQVPPFDPQILNKLGSLFLTRPTLADYTLDGAEVAWRMNDLFDAVLAGDLKVTVDQTFPLADAKSAHDYLEARKTRGKVVLVP